LCYEIDCTNAMFTFNWVLRNLVLPFLLSSAERKLLRSQHSTAIIIPFI
jgi:hypothetical protein